MENILPEIQIKYIKGTFEKIQIKGSKDVFNTFKNLFYNDTFNYKEEVIIIYTDNNHNTIAWHRHSIGSINGSIVDVRIIFALALKIGATGFAMAHNHPSGNNQPSEADKKITEKLVYASRIMDFTFIDHLILFEDENQEIRFTSFRELGYF